MGNLNNWWCGIYTYVDEQAPNQNVLSILEIFLLWAGPRPVVQACYTMYYITYVTLFVEMQANQKPNLKTSIFFSNMILLWIPLSNNL